MKKLSNIARWIYLYIYCAEIIEDEKYVLYVLDRTWQSGSEIRNKIHALGGNISIGVLYNVLDRLAHQCVIEEKIDQQYSKSLNKKQHVFKCTARMRDFLIA
jgi:hypothetical protein